MNKSDKTKIVYMIRRKSDGLYSTGGSSPSFTKRGKVWSTIGALKNHINLGTDQYHWRPTKATVELGRPMEVSNSFARYKDCEIVCLEIVHNEKPQPFDLLEYMKEKLKKEAQDKLEYYTKYEKHENLVINIKHPDGTTEKVTNGN